MDEHLNTRPGGTSRERVDARRRDNRRARVQRLRTSTPLRVGAVVVVIVVALAVFARPLQGVIRRLAVRVPGREASRGTPTVGDTAAGAPAHVGPSRPSASSDGAAGGGSGAGRRTGSAKGTAAAGSSAGQSAGEQRSTAGTGKVPDAVRRAALPYPGPAAVQPETIVRGHPKSKLVAITLDDGIPFDERLLELFEREGVRGTTFVLGQFAVQRPDLIRRLHRDGFEIANHSYSHPFLTKLSDGEIVSELTRAQAAISKITGNQAPYLRPPYGATSSRIKVLAAKRGYRIVLWSKTFADTSASATPEQLYKNVMDGLAPGDIILCHWGGRDTYEAMKMILPAMRQRGFTPVTLSEMLADAR